MKRTKLRKLSKNPMRVLKRKAWKIFSEWIRKRDKYKCFTCSKQLTPQNSNAGHYIHKDCMDFNEKNINCQCVFCNSFKHGNLIEYGIRLEKKYGYGILQTLKREGDQIKKFKKSELEQIIKKYEEMFKS